MPNILTPLVVASAALTAIAAQPVYAAPTIYTSKPAFDAATSGTIFNTVDFEMPFSASNTLFFSGVTISCSNCAAGRTGSYPTSGAASLGINGGNPVTFSFTQAVTAFGLSIRDFGTLSATNLQLTVNGVTTSLLSNFQGMTGNTLYFGVTESVPFYTATLSGGVSGDNYYLDDLRFASRAEATAVPEAATWAMMISGFGIMGAAMRRRSTKVAMHMM